MRLAAQDSGARVPDRRGRVARSGGVAAGRRVVDRMASRRVGSAGRADAGCRHLAFRLQPRRADARGRRPESRARRGTQGQRALTRRRDDVLVFRGPVLDRPVVVAGTPTAGIRFRSSQPSFDVFVRITDVHPDGRSVTVTDGIRRIGTHGTTDTDPTADDEGWREVTVSLWPSFHRFAAGHRIGVQISSGAHPRYARNPGSVQPAAGATSLGVAHQEIAHGGDRGSRIVLPTWHGERRRNTLVQLNSHPPR